MKEKLNSAFKEISEAVQLTRMMVTGLRSYEDQLDRIKSSEDYYLKIQKISRDEYNSFLATSEKSWAFYLNQKQTGFTKAYEMSLVYLWGRIDNLIKDLLIDYIDTDSKLLEYKKMPKIKLDLNFIAMSEYDQKYYLISQIEQGLSTPLKNGIKKFEDLLDVFELGGKVPKILSDKMYEISNIRNVIAHNGSIVDNKFIDRCPNLGYSLGQRISLNQAQYVSYSYSLMAYITVLDSRFKGEEVTEEDIRSFIDIDVWQDFFNSIGDT